MKNVIVGLLASITFMVFIGCEREVDSEITYADADTQGAVLFVVGNSQNGVSDSGATVTMVIEGKDVVKITDSSGQARFNDIVVGNHFFSVSREGYGTIWGDVTVTTSGANTTIPLVEDQTVLVQLKRTGVLVSGTVAYEDVTGSIPVAEGAIVELKLEDPANQIWDNPIFIDTVDSSGSYQFTDLPEHTAYSISVIPYTDAQGVVYTQGGVVHGSGEYYLVSKVTPLITLEFDAPRLQLVSHNLGTLTSTSDLVFSFSEPINQTLAQIDVEEGGALIPTNHSFSADGKALSITLASGTWIVGEDYEVIFDLTSTKGVPLNRNDESISFTF